MSINAPAYSITIMNKFLYQHVKNLKKVILSLHPTGESGFEGLIGTTLCEISGVPFRLAGSGSQFGVDGKPTYDGNSICFEGKRYDDTIPKNELLSKIAEISIEDNEIDVWVLGATSEIMSQLADSMRKLGNKNGISVLILDWSEINIPPFAVALAMGGIRTQEFMKRNIRNGKALRKGFEALEAIKNYKDYTIHAERIQKQCNEPAFGWTLAQRANADWMIDAFSSKKQAKIKFRQALSPGDSDIVTVRQRTTLNNKLYQYFTITPDKTVVSIIGGEGHGKSWVIAQSWLALAHKPLMVFMIPEDFVETTERTSVTDMLIAKLIEQTGDRLSEITQERWRRRLVHWKNHRAENGPRLVVVIDGINQRPNLDWARIVEIFGDELNKLGGRLIITSRTPYFRDRVERRLTLSLSEIHVPEWTESERDEILAHRGIIASNLHPAVAESLRNPRLLGIALDLLVKADITTFEELSVSRLLFEHMRTSERDAPITQPVQEFAHRLQKHAQEIISRVEKKTV